MSGWICLAPWLFAAAPALAAEPPAPAGEQRVELTLPQEHWTGDLD